MNKRKDIVPNHLKEYRIAAGLKQKDVARYLGFATVERISHWEKGNNVPNLINLFKLATLYRATPMQLYGDLLNTIEDDMEMQRLKC